MQKSPHTGIHKSPAHPAVNPTVIPAEAGIQRILRAPRALRGESPYFLSHRQHQIALLTISSSTLNIEHMNYYKYYKNLRLDELGISSDEEAEELEYELEVRFGDFTARDRKTWLQQNTYLEHFSRIGTFSSAARETGVTVYKAQTWKFNNVLGFTRRLEVATLMFNDRLKEKALRRASDPKAPVTLLIELLRAYIPEEFSRNGHKCDTSKSDEILRRFREDAQREKDAGYPRLRKLAEGATNAHPHDDHVPSYSNLSPAGGEIHNTNLSPAEGEIHNTNLSPAEGEIHNTNLSPLGERHREGVPPVPSAESNSDNKEKPKRKTPSP